MNYLKNKGKRKKTIQFYVYNIERFEEMGKVDADRLTASDVNEMLYKKLKLSPKSIHQITSALRKYFEFLGKRDEAQKIEKPDRYRSEEKERFLYPDELKTLLNSDKLDEAEKLIVKFLIFLGVRRGVVANLKVRDVNFSSKRVNVPAEITGNKASKSYETVELGEELASELEQWIEKHRLKPNDLLFKPILRKVKAREQFVTDMIARIGRKVGIKLTPHILRHTFGTYYYYKTKDIIKTRNVMGQKTVQATGRYIHLAEKLEDYLNKDKEKWADFMEKTIKEVRSD